MRLMKPVSRVSLTAAGIVLGTVPLLGLLTRTVVVAEAPKAEAIKKNIQSGSGEFVSYKDGTLTLKVPRGNVVWSDVGENYKTFERDEDGRPTKPVGTVAALSSLKAGTSVRINGDKAEIYYGVDEATHGTFVSYKDGKLTVIGRAEELGASFTKKYGTTISSQIDPKVPVFETIDGGEFKQIGTAEALSSVKEGAIVTLRGKSDTITSIQIGVRKKK